MTYIRRGSAALIEGGLIAPLMVLAILLATTLPLGRRRWGAHWVTLGVLVFGLIWPMAMLVVACAWLRAESLDDYGAWAYSDFDTANSPPY